MKCSLLFLIPFILVGCTPITAVYDALTGNGGTVGATIYALDEAYVVTADTVAAAITDGLVSNTATIVALKADSGAAAQALVTASNAEAAGASNAAALLAAAQTAVRSYESDATTAGVSLPASAAIPSSN